MLYKNLRKRITILTVLLSTASMYAIEPKYLKYPAHNDTVYMKDFIHFTDTYQDATLAFIKALDTCRETHAKVLKLSHGRYDLWPMNANKREVYISNTSSEIECPSKVKAFGIDIMDVNDLTIDGNGASIICHGKMTMMSISGSENIKIKNLIFDYERPPMSEMTVVHRDSINTILRFHHDSDFHIDENKRIVLHGEDWKMKYPHAIEKDAETGHFLYNGKAWRILSKSDAELLDDGTVKFITGDSVRLDTGDILTVRDRIRDNVGILIHESKNISLDNIDFRASRSLGIVGQRTKNITLDNIRCKADTENGRIMASCADFMHFSGCAGKITVTNCTFSGSQDDAINVHGTNMLVNKILGPDSMLVRFMHHQSYGFTNIEPGDTIAFVSSFNLLREDTAVIEKINKVSQRDFIVKINKNIPHDVKEKLYCIENLTWTPELEVTNCYISNLSTRGVLATTPRKVVISNNYFEKTGMSAILIESDAADWFESGPVQDVTIQNNVFNDCGYNGGPAHAVIAIHPSNSLIDENYPVHENVRIQNNKFNTFGNPLLYAKSTGGLEFIDNEALITYPVPHNYKMMRTRYRDLSGGAQLHQPFVIIGCKNPQISSNKLEGYADYRK